MTDQSNTLTTEIPKRGWGIGRILLYVLGGFVGFIAIALAIVFWATSGIVDTADQFLAKLRADDYRAAYELSSTGFKKTTDFDAFKVFVAKHDLTSTTSGNWASRETSGVGDGATGTLEGSLVGPDGGATPATLVLVKEAGKWRVHSIDVNNAGTRATQVGAAKAKSIPAEHALIELVHASDIAFAEAVEAESMEGFHKHISALWAKQHSVAQLEGFFGTFIEKKINLLAIGESTPVFSRPAAINGDGLLVVSGFYDTKPSRAEFRHKYIFEGFGWKLAGYKLEVGPRPDNEIKDGRGGETKAGDDKGN